MVVVDEAMLALTGYRSPDPIDASLLAAASADVRDHYLRAVRHCLRQSRRRRGRRWRMQQRTERPKGGAMADSAAAEATAPSAGGAVGQALSAPTPPATEARQRPRRSDRGRRRAAPRRPSRCARTSTRWRLFAPAVQTDAQGHATVDVQAARQPHALPGHGGRGCGRASSSARARSTITARLPLMVRPSPPRFLNFGDRFELPVVVQNQTDAADDGATSRCARQRHAHRRRRPRGDGAGQRSRRGAVPGRGRRAPARRASRSRSRPAAAPTRPSSRCRCGRRRPPRRSRPTA